MSRAMPYAAVLAALMLLGACSDKNDEAKPATPAKETNAGANHEGEEHGDEGEEHAEGGKSIEWDQGKRGWPKT